MNSPYLVVKDEYYSYSEPNYSHLQGRVIGRLDEPKPPKIPLGWFLLILAVDVACLIGIYAGIAKALGR